MGLTNESVGTSVKNTDGVRTLPENGRLIALAGNPNVGKSTLFNLLTKMHQHTGNWPGKTVGSAYGFAVHNGTQYIFADIPGTYSLIARSQEEAVARDALMFGNAEAVIIVCDATCLRRNMNLALQILEICGSAVLCVNLMDEAERKGIVIDTAELSKRLGIPVIGMSAANGEGIEQLYEAISQPLQHSPRAICCGCNISHALRPLTEYFAAYRPPLPPEWLALRIAEGDNGMISTIESHLGMDYNDSDLQSALELVNSSLDSMGVTAESLADISAQRLNDAATQLCDGVIKLTENAPALSTKLDRILTHKFWGWPAMLLMLAAVLWLTIRGANYPSRLLSGLLFDLGGLLRTFMHSLAIPEIIISMFIDGIYKTTAWVVAVMLPPMAIFFPLFTLMEDLGYLPRVAFNLDGFFKRCDACGKQSLTMCMGFGCNAAGVIGCRIIDSPRERLIAVLTNSFVPCNGRFPTMIALISIFFAGGGVLSSLNAAAIMTGMVVLGIVMTLLTSKLLSSTVLKGVSSSFTLELPPYRKPKVCEIIVRSVFDRTLFVLGRAVKTAVPAGLLIWCLANITIKDTTLLSYISSALDPAAALIGLDGAILLAFILALPANEIVIPAVLMCYLSGSSLVEYGTYDQLFQILTANGWNCVTAACTILFTLMHWPCATTLLTIRKETGSRAYTVLAALLPAVCGILICFAVNCIFN